MSKKRRRHSPEQIIKKLRDVDAMLAGWLPTRASARSCKRSRSAKPR